MKCATNAFVVLASFAVTTLPVTSSDAGRISTNGQATSTLHGMVNAAAGMLTRFGGLCAASCIKVPSDFSEWPPITKGDMKSETKWFQAMCSEDSTMLNRMLKLCKGRGEPYTSLMHTACWSARTGRHWDKYTKIIEAMCMDLDSPESPVHVHINDALGEKDASLLVATLRGVAGNDQMTEDIGKILAVLVMMGLGDHPGNIEEICESVTHTGLRELSAVAMIENRHERLVASAACFTRSKDLPQGLIEEIARFAYDNEEYRALEVLLRARPSNGEALRGWLVHRLFLNILHTNLDEVYECIRIFDISAAEIHDPLKSAVMRCINSGSPEKFDNIVKFLDNAIKVHSALNVKVRYALKNVIRECTIDLGSIRMFEYIFLFLGNRPQQYKLAVDAALKRYEDITQLDIESLKCYKGFQNWTAKEESRQKKEDRKWQMAYAHLNPLHPMT